MEYQLDKFKEGLEKLNITLSDDQIEQFLSYYEMLIEKNKVMNLTTITEYEEVIEKHFLDSISLCKVYDKSIEQYKNQVLKKLRVPLLIYTAKILQDYQNGLGVFINKDEMRFVSNCDAKHDILNTFSSGQLSGFVLKVM